MPKIPSQIVDFSLYNLNDRLMGHGEEITLPKIVSKVTSIILAGGDFDVPSLMTENMEMEIPFTLFDEEAGGLVTFNKTSTVIARGSAQKIDTGTHDFNYSGLKVTSKGFTKEVDLGTLKRADGMNSKITQTLSYIKVENGDGYVFIEIDKLNGTFIVNNKNMREGIEKYL